MSDEPTNFLPGFPPAPKRGETKVIDRGLATAGESRSVDKPLPQDDYHATKAVMLLRDIVGRGLLDAYSQTKFAVERFLVGYDHYRKHNPEQSDVSAARDTSSGSIHPAVQQIIDAGPWGDGNIAVAADTFRRWATRIASWSFQLGQKQGDRLATSASKDSGEWNAAIVAAVKVCHDKVLDRENPFDNGCWSCAVAVSSLTRDVNVGQTGEGQ